MLNREFYRRGPNHPLPNLLSEGPATFLDIRQRFNFRSVQIGKWVTKQEQAVAAPLFYDALCDLMTILGGNEDVVSLRGTLALQYGCGGQPGVSAHYDPQTRSFALAKNAGPGSIAHEWFHAFDHYIREKAFLEIGDEDFGSCAWLENTPEISHPLNEKLSWVYQCIILDGDEPSDYFNRALLVDKAMDADYYSRPEELCARAFEAFIQDASIKNNFLVKGTKQSSEAKLGLYPEGEHRQKINEALKDYFFNLGRVLKRQAEKEAVV